MLRTGKQYLETLDDGRVVRVRDEKIKQHRHPSGSAVDYAKRIADFYDLHHRPDLTDIMTFVDDDGERRSMMWFRRANKDELRRKRRYLETVIRELDGGAAPRTPDVNNYPLLTYVDDPEPWSEQALGTGGRDLVAGILQFWDLMVAGDLNAAPAFVDPQADRSREAAQAESPALRVVQTREDGIVVRGVKAITTSTPFAQTTSTSASSSTPASPASDHLRRRPTGDPRGHDSLPRKARLKEGEQARPPLATKGDKLDTVNLFDDIFIHSNIFFHMRNFKGARCCRGASSTGYPGRRSFARRSAAEVILGLALLITEHISSSLSGLPHRFRLGSAQLRGLPQTMFAHVIACGRGRVDPPGGGLYKPTSCCSTSAGPLMDTCPDGQRAERPGRRSALIFPTEPVEPARAAPVARAVADGPGRPTARPAQDKQIHPGHTPFRTRATGSHGLKTSTELNC